MRGSEDSSHGYVLSLACDVFRWKIASKQSQHEYTTLQPVIDVNKTTDRDFMSACVHGVLFMMKFCFC